MPEKNRESVFFLIGSFLAGAALMIIELLAVRIMAPIVGASVFTWTSAIGVILVGLSVGAYAGGKMADKFPEKTTLGLSFIASSAATALIPVFEYFSAALLTSTSGILFLNLALAGALFFIPALFLGTVQPIIVKLYSKNYGVLGEEYGILSAMWSVGSILGVFLTGFYLISRFGILSIIYGVSGTLFILGTVFFFYRNEKRSRRIKIIFVSLIVIIVLSFAGYYVLTSSKKDPAIFKKNSAYYRIKVIDAPFGQAGQSRFLFLDADVHSVESKTGEKSFLYTDSYPIFREIKEQIHTIHVIGGGAYTLPKAFAQYYKEAKVSVSEIDKDVQSVAEHYFGLDSSVVSTDHRDPRYAFRLSDAKYDIIFGDAYSSFVSVPGHLLTYEFNETVKEHLTPSGVYALNIASAASGNGSSLFQSVQRTFLKTFPNTIIIAFSPDPTVLQNIILIGSLSEKPIDRSAVIRTLDLVINKNKVIARVLSKEETVSWGDGVFLTDDFVPVESLMIPAVERYFQSYFQFYKAFLEEGLFFSNSK